MMIRPSKIGWHQISLVSAATMLSLATTGYSDLKSDSSSDERGFAEGLDALVSAVEEFRKGPEDGFDRSDAHRGYEKCKKALENIIDRHEGSDSQGSNDDRYASEVEERLKELKGTVRATIERELPELASAYEDYLKRLRSGLNEFARRKEALCEEAEQLLASRKGQVTLEKVGEFNESLGKQETALVEYREDERKKLQFGRSAWTAPFRKAVKAFNAPSLRADSWDSLESALGGTGRSVDAKGREVFEDWTDALGRSKLGKRFDDAQKKLRGSLYHNIDQSKSKADKKWLVDGRIKGTRWYRTDTDRYYILVTVQKRDEDKMAAWLLKCAKDTKKAKFDATYGSGSYDRVVDSKGVKRPPGYEVHHKIPLYVGTENGGRDVYSNYELIEKSEHDKEHDEGGSAHARWGHHRIYVHKN
ncbi:MAG: HNH endonuclease [bacterium]|nr:HNH endonuclease [bacterium]